jgi:RNA recognition motif-containing protein
VICETDQKDTVKFCYPKSKIFVGGLDFKLTNEELKEHFTQFGEVTDAIILKDIYNGQSRGFGFVSFKEEDRADWLVRCHPITEINGRRVDIKKAVVKQGGNGLPNNPRASYAAPTQDHHQPAHMPPYQHPNQREAPREQLSRSPSRDRYEKRRPDDRRAGSRRHERVTDERRHRRSSSREDGQHESYSRGYQEARRRDYDRPREGRSERHREGRRY